MNIWLAVSTFDWKADTSPTKEESLSKVRYIFLMSKLTAINRYRMGEIKAIEVFLQLWKPFVTFSSGQDKNLFTNIVIDVHLQNKINKNTN